MQKKEKKLCKKSSTSSAAHEYNGVSQGDTPSPPLPPQGGEGGARSMPRGWHGICWEQVPCQVCVKIEKRFLRFISTFCKDFKCKRQIHARKKVKKSIRKIWTNLGLSSNLWAWKTKRTKTKTKKSTSSAQRLEFFNLNPRKSREVHSVT